LDLPKCAPERCTWKAEHVVAKALIVYGTTEGQTAKIAQHLADAGRKLGHGVDVVHAP
jgi:hypothetical protein